MQAINHAATALILKRKFPSAPLFGLILATEAVEYLWVGLNLIGIERTVIDDGMASVADIHLEHMPFSHSIVTSFLAAAAVGLAVLWRGGRAASAVATAMALGVLSHIVLDLLVHAPDIALAPYFDEVKFGSGLYAGVPMTALALETLWGLLCWRVYGGGWKLLGLMALLALAAVPSYSANVNVGEAALGGQSTVFALTILLQMLVTSALLWHFARERRACPAAGRLAA